MSQQIIVAVFPSRSVLTEALDALQNEATMHIEKAIVVIKQKSGKVRIIDDNIGTSEGRFVGGAMGALLMSIGSVVTFPAPSIFAALVGLGGVISGTLIGWGVGSWVPSLFRLRKMQSYVQAFADKLQEETPALMLTVKDAQALLPRIQAGLQSFRPVSIETLSE